MTPEAFKTAIEKLGLDLSAAAVLFGTHPRTTRRWANAERKVPPPVCNFLRHLLAEARAEARARAKSAKTTRAPKARKTNGKIRARVGPTIQCEFADGTVTRMSVFTAVEKLDWDRGIRLSQAAWQSRWQTQYRKQNGRAAALIDTVAPVPPVIVTAHFEQDGKVLAQREF